MLSLLFALAGASSASAAPGGPSLYANGLHVSAGGLVDPDNRVWVSDHNGGFCRLTAPDDRGPGTLDHPSTPGEPDSVTRTCLGGLLPDAAIGPDAAGQPAFHDPTPELPGSGDEIALIPDGASPSMDVWRAHWNPHTKLFETDPDTDVIRMDADTAEDRPRPTTVTIAPNGTAYVVFQRSSSIQRILDIDGATPRVELVGFTSDAVGTAALAAGYGPLGPMGPPTLYVGESTGLREIAGTQGDVNRTTSPSTFAPAGFLASTLAYHPTNTTSGQGTLYAGTASALPPLVLPGPDSVVRLQANAAPEVVASGFSTVGGMAIRPTDGALFAFDDPALAMETEPLGIGRAFIIGNPFTEILTGPSTPADQPALDPEYTADSTPEFTYAGEFARQCSLTPATAATNVWLDCDATTYTASELLDGRYRFAVRSVDRTVPATPKNGPADTRYFTVDTVAPTAAPLILNPKPDSNHLRAPRYSFDNDDPAEGEFGYQCKIDDDAEYTPCDEGLSDSPIADGDHTLQIKLVDGAGNVGTTESASITYNVGTDPGTDTDPVAFGPLSNPNSASVYGEGLHIATGAMEDPAGRLWIADHNAGFCRMTDPTIDGAGQIEHPQTPNRPRAELRTCLGGLLPDAGAGADAAGPPTFVDPTPRRPGNGDEVVIVADGFSQSNFLVRFRWDPGTELFEYLDQITVPAIQRPEQDRPRPVTTQIGPDPDGIDGPKQPSVFFTNTRDTYIGRVDQPAGDNPTVGIAGFVAAGGDRAQVLAVGQRPEGGEQHPVIYLVGAALETLNDPRIEGEPNAPATLTATATPVAGVAGIGAMQYDLQRNLLYIGTSEALVEDAAGNIVEANHGTDRLVRVNPATMTVQSQFAGFSMVGGIGLRTDGRILVVDDEALLDPAEPLGAGVLHQIGNPAARITGGPSDNGIAATHPGFTSDTTPTFTLAGDTPRECWVRLASSTATPSWSACNGTSYTPAALANGEFKLTVRATTGSTPATISDTTKYVPHTMKFTVDTIAPTVPSVTSVLPMAADGRTNAEPYFTFAGEAGVSYGCRLNSATYNKTPCQPGRTFPRSGNVRVAEGANTLRIRATDKAGNTSGDSAPFTFQADTTIPTVTISSPGENQVTGTEVRFVFRASQTAGTRYGCRIDGQTFVSCEQPSDAGGAGRPFAVENLADGSVAVTYRNLSLGEHRFQVHASDNHNNVSPNASRNIRVDLSAPVALIDAPGIGETTGRATTLASHIDPSTIGAGETNTLTCSLRRGTTNVPLSECDESIPVSGLQSGAHTFTVQARDSAGNTGPQASRTWTVDGTGPVITIARTGGFLSPARFTISTSEPAALLCRFDQRPMQDCATINGANIGSGRHTLFVTGTDAFGNAGSAQNEFTLTFANDATVTVPANRLVPVSITQANLRALGLPVTFTAEEDAALAQVRILRATTVPTLSRAATSTTSKKKVSYKRIVTVTRKPKAGLNKMRLKDRVIRDLLKPGSYKVEVRQRRQSGKYGKPLSATIQVKRSTFKKK